MLVWILELLHGLIIIICFITESDSSIEPYHTIPYHHMIDSLLQNLNHPQNWFTLLLYSFYLTSPTHRPIINGKSYSQTHMIYYAICEPSNHHRFLLTQKKSHHRLTDHHLPVESLEMCLCTKHIAFPNATPVVS